MKNQRSPLSDQILRFLLLWLAATLIFNHFFASKQDDKKTTAARTMPVLQKAFEGIDPQSGKLLSAEAGRAEVARLGKEIEANPTDDYSYWARLRSGLVQQYVLGELESKPLPVPFWSKLVSWYAPPPTHGTIYDEIINHGAANDIDAQAIYQKGDMLYRLSRRGQSIHGKPVTAQEAATALSLLLHRGRGASPFLDLKIQVPNRSAAPSAAGDVLPPATTPAAIPASGFVLVSVRELLQTPNNPNPPGILERVNSYYATTSFYQIFNSTVKFLGGNPAYSYGLAIIVFAFFTRLLMQPLNKKQYESMKGMQIIAPEMKKIQEKYKGKADQQMQMQMIKEMRELQSRHGVNPQMGCLLAFVQWPVFLFLVYPMIQNFEPKMELVGASFGWVANLAHPDVPLLVLYSLSMLVSFRLSATPPTDEQQRMITMMMTFVMPLMLPFFMKGFSSAFILYWMTFNLVSTILQYRMMKASDPNKSVIKTLLGESPSPLPESNVKAVPPRPKKKLKRDAETTLSVISEEEALNGKAAGRRKEKVASEKPSSEEAFRDAENALQTGRDGDAPASTLNGSSIKSDAESGAAGNGTSGNGTATVPRRENQGREVAGDSASRRAGSQRARRRRRH